MVATRKISAPTLRAKRRSMSLAILTTLWRDRRSRLGLLMLSGFLILYAFGPWIAPYSPSQAVTTTMHGPTWKDWLGTTQSGQDVLSQLIWGTRVSLSVAFLVGIFSTLFALFIGLVQGTIGGPLDQALGFLTNVFLVLPGLPLIIVVAAYAPAHGLDIIVLVIVITSWAWGSRVYRSQVISLNQRDYVVAARLSGDSNFRIMYHEILPNMMSLVAAHFLGACMTGLLAATGLEFLGLGNPGTNSWGTMLFWAQNDNALPLNQWAWIVAPGIAIALFGMSLALINFGLDAIANPQLREASQ